MSYWLLIDIRKHHEFMWRTYLTNYINFVRRALILYNVKFGNSAFSLSGEMKLLILFLWRILDQKKMI